MSNIYSSSYFGSKVIVYPNRVEWTFPGNGTKSIPISQIASVSSAMMGVLKVTIETTGGQRFHIATHKKRELVDAINSVLSPQTIPQEVVAFQSKNTSSDTPWYMWIVFLVFWPISLSYWVIKKSNWPRLGKVVAILTILILAVAVYSRDSTTLSQVTDQNTGQSLEDASSSASILQPDANSESDPMLTSEELGYLDRAISINKNVVDGMQAISSMSDNPIAIYTNDEMRSRVAAGMVIVQMSYQDAKNSLLQTVFQPCTLRFWRGCECTTTESTSSLKRSMRLTLKKC